MPAFSSNLAITVLDPYAVQSYMGHQHYSTTQRYLHHKPRPQDALRLQAAADAENPSRCRPKRAEPGEMLAVLPKLG